MLFFLFSSMCRTSPAVLKGHSLDMSHNATSPSQRPVIRKTEVLWGTLIEKVQISFYATRLYLRGTHLLRWVIEFSSRSYLLPRDWRVYSTRNYRHAPLRENNPVASSSIADFRLNLDAPLAVNSLPALYLAISFDLIRWYMRVDPYSA